MSVGAVVAANPCRLVRQVNQSHSKIKAAPYALSLPPGPAPEGCRAGGKQVFLGIDSARYKTPSPAGRAGRGRSERNKSSLLPLAQFPVVKSNFGSALGHSTRFITSDGQTVTGFIVLLQWRCSKGMGANMAEPERKWPKVGQLRAENRNFGPRVGPKSGPECQPHNGTRLRCKDL